MCQITGGQDYLEIGCANNALFHSVFADNKIGVDPQSGGTHRMTSDEFFENNKQKFDVIFIDGLHEFQQVHNDLLNSIKCLKKGGIIAFHDMIPRNWLEEHMPRINSVWTGDVWKVAFELLQATGVDFKIVKADHGVGVLRLTGDKIDVPDLSDHLRSKRFEYFCKNYSSLPIIEINVLKDWVGS